MHFTIDRLCGLALGLIACAWLSCKKLVQINAPTNSITTSQIFADSLDATSALSGVYNQLIATGSSVQFGDGLITLYGGLSADELLDLSLQYQDLDYNILKAPDGIPDQLWENAYTYLYPINSCIQSIQTSTGISAAAKNQLTGEAEFLRALCYFYLVNLYGDVPLILGTSYAVNDLAVRTPSAQVYQQIVTDLKAAQSNLKADYSISGGQRTRANQAAATALLARVYLYTGDWADAAAQASAVIANPAYSLLSDLNTVFLANSNEAILQWQLSGLQSPYNATPEGTQLLPGAPGYPPLFYLNSGLTGAFEPGDLRWASWVDSALWNGTNYYYAYKYKLGYGQFSPGAPLTEYYMVLRLAEQYLIRAEAEANGANGGDAAAIADLNILRARAGLTALPGTLTAPQVTAAVAQERRIELFAEWGHRWFDLKRTKQIDAVMTVATPLKGGNTQWASYQQLYPVPLYEIKTDPNLTQNPQY